MKKNTLQLLFYAAFTGYWFMVTILGNSGLNIQWISNTFLVIGCISFILTWIQIKFSIRGYVFQVIALIFLLFVYIKSGAKNEGILLILPAIVCVKNINIKQVARIMFITMLFLEIVTLVFTVIGIIPYNTNIKYDNFGKMHKVIMLANMHGNANYMPIFTLIALYIYIYYSKLDLKRSIILCIISMIFYEIFACKTGTILSNVLIWGLYLSKRIKYQNKIIKNRICRKIIEHFQLIMFIFVYVVAIFMYESTLFNVLDSVVSSRMMEAYVYIDRYGLNLFPRVIEFYICDNSQTYIMLSFGLIFTALYSFLYFKAIKNLIANNKLLEVYIIIIYILYSYSEAAFIKPFPNFSMLFLIYAFYPNRNMEDNNEVKSNIYLKNITN